jgi:AraC-like DNA-binding protein
MDVLTEALASMRTARPASVRTDGRAPWGLRLPPVAGAGFHVVLHGRCWLVPTAADQSDQPDQPDKSTDSGRLGGPAEPLRLETGDVVFLRSGPEHVLADAPDTPPHLAGPVVFRDNSAIGVCELGGSGEPTNLLCGNYHLENARPHPLVRQLPEIVHLRTGQGEHPELAAAVALLRAELDRPRVGSAGIVPALIDSLLLYILRAWLDEQPAGAVGWAGALTDPAIAPALTAMHANPAESWTVESLAGQAGLSRAAFAKRFHALVGEPPLAYLTHWRMTTAAGLLRETDAPLAAVAARTGYGSEFAFAKAFKRAYGQAPGGYRRAHSAPSSRTGATASTSAGAAA